MTYSTQELLRFPPVGGLTVRGDVEGGALSSDFGPLLLRGVDRQIGLTERLATAFQDHRHPSYLTHSLQDLFAQRIYQIACAYEDGNDANALRTDYRDAEGNLLAGTMIMAGEYSFWIPE